MVKRLGDADPTTLNYKDVEGHVGNVNNPHSVSKSQVGLSNVINTKHNLDATIDPTDEGIQDGYSSGSIWVNVNNNNIFVFVDGSPSEWVNLTATTGSSESSAIASFLTSVATVATTEIDLNDCPDVIDGVTLNDSLFVLLTAQGGSPEGIDNGVYQFNPGTPNTLSRLDNLSDGTEILPGCYVYIGDTASTHANSIYYLQDQGPWVTIGTDPLTWGEFVTGAGSVKTDAVNIFTASQICDPTSANTGSIDLSDSNNFSIVPTSNVTVSNPSNIVAGQSGHIYIDASTYTISWGTYWKFEGGNAPDLSGDSIIAYYVKSTTEIIASVVMYV